MLQSFVPEQVCHDMGEKDRPSDVDVVSQRRLGWPTYKDGPLFHADSEGLAQVLARLTALERVHGQHLKPAALLVQLAKASGTFSFLN